jgi:hypothetical protein
MPSEFVADGPLSYTPTNADPTQFGITFIPSDQGAIEAAHIRIAGTIYPAQRNPQHLSGDQGRLSVRAQRPPFADWGLLRWSPGTRTSNPLLSNET